MGCLQNDGRRPPPYIVRVHQPGWQHVQNHRQRRRAEERGFLTRVNNTG